MDRTTTALASPARLESPAWAARLLDQTRRGRRQWATAQVLTRAPGPLAAAPLIAAVEARAGRGCYSTRPAYTLHADLQALRAAGVPVRYSRAAGLAGYYLPDPTTEARRQAARLLRQVGWHPSDWQQIGVYAGMPPARKVAQLFRLRHSFMEQLRRRLRADHPAATAAEITALVLQELAGVREDPPHE